MTSNKKFNQALSRYIYRGVDKCSRSKGKQDQRYKEHYNQEGNLSEKIKKIETKIGALYSQRILELSSGTGGVSVALALRGANVFGIEPEESGVEVSVLRGKRYKDIQVDFIQGYAETIPFENCQGLEIMNRF